jgi:hypothetical protein
MFLYQSYAKWILFYSVFIFPISSLADNHRNFSIGLTQTNNLEIQQGESVKRIGISHDFSFLKQSLNYAGGYTLETQFNYNKSLDNTGDIARIHLAASRLLSLNNNWLMRSRAVLQHYNHQPVQINSYTALQLENTLGYLHTNNQGVDINLTWRLESHNQAENDHYKTRNIGLALSHYFPHQDQSAYWASHIGFTRYNADDKHRDFTRLSTGLEYRQWHIGKFTGSASLQWEYDQYKFKATPYCLSKLSKSQCTEEIKEFQANNSRQSKQKDHYIFSEISISQPIKKSVNLQLSASMGRYRSSIQNIDENFYRLSSRINWNF